MRNIIRLALMLSLVECDVSYNLVSEKGQIFIRIANVNNLKNKQMNLNCTFKSVK